jgi:CheY-like chemotaxis protein
MMNQQLNWQSEREDEMEALYRSAAERFATQSEFAAFLLTLAEQEREHGKLLRQLLRPEVVGATGVDQLCDPGVRQSTEKLIAASLLTLDSANLTEQHMLEVIARLEFSEWNSLFLLTMNWSGQNDGEFRHMLDEIELHRKTIEDYLLQAPGADELYQIIHNLAPLWRKRILIVDDDPVIARLLEIIMTPFGNLEVTTHPADALQHLRQRRFDVMISDVCMPDMNGIELYQQAIKLDPDIGKHFIFFTATNHQEHLRFIAEHNIPTLKKPAPLKVLQEAVMSLLS